MSSVIPVAKFLLTQADWIPVQDAYELPWVLVELELELAFFVDHQFSGRVEKSQREPTLPAMFMAAARTLL